MQLAPGAKVTTVSSGADEVIEVEFGSVPPLYAVPVGIETGHRRSSMPRHSPM